MIRNVIFDWSGTLVDDLPAVLEATNHVLRQAGLPEMSRERFRAEFKLPFTGFYEQHLPGIPMAQLEAWFHGRFREVHHTVTPLPHAREFLEFCRAHGIRTLLLSTMHADYFRAQAQAAAFDGLIEHPYLGVWDKRKKIHEILATHGLRPDETVFVGDMEHDVETAKHGGIHSVAVLTGYTGSEALRRAGPDLVVEHLGELKAILEENRLCLTRGAGNGTSAGRAPVVTVGAVIFAADGRLLMVRTHKWSNRWGIPGGKVKWGESCEAALRRELLEETGLDVEEVRFVLVQDCIRSPEFYRDEHFVLLNYSCRARADAPVVLNDEAQEYRWVTLEEAFALPLNRPTLVLLRALRGEGVKSER